MKARGGGKQEGSKEVGKRGSKDEGFEGREVENYNEKGDEMRDTP